MPLRSVLRGDRYVVGIVTHRSDLSTILTTVLITALPTYGAALRKMILRIVGAIQSAGRFLFSNHHRHAQL